MKTHSTFKIAGNLLLLLLWVSLLTLASCKKFKTVYPIQYPEGGIHGTNILYLTRPDTLPEGEFSFCAEVPEGKTLKIFIEGQNITEAISHNLVVWYYVHGTVNGWSPTGFDWEHRKEEFNIISDDQKCDMKMIIKKGTYKIRYEEHGEGVNTFERNLVIQ